MNETQQSELAMLRLSVRDLTAAAYLDRAAERIRTLPRVVRVRADVTRGQLEIVFQHPAEGLLRQIHEALQAAHCGIVSGKAY